MINLPTLSDFIKGTPAILSCQASGNPKPKLTWSKNGHQNIPEAHIKQEGRLLVFPSIQPEHGGVYTCTATNQFGNASTSTNVTVIGKVTCSSCFLVYYHHLNFRIPLTLPTILTAPRLRNIITVLAACVLAL